MPPVRNDPAVLKRLVADYLRTKGQTEEARLDAYTVQNGITDDELLKQFQDFFDESDGKGTGVSGAQRAEVSKPMPPAKQASSSDLFSDLASLGGAIFKIGTVFTTSLACAAADTLNPVCKLGEAAVDSVEDAALNGQRAKAAEWLKQRGLGPAEQQAILNVVRRAAYWHGTGRHQYAAAGQSKYDGVTNDVADNLQHIVDAGGLTPQFDPYYSSGAKDGATVSMAQCRMYARYYAQIHQLAGRDLQFQYGAAGDWVTLMGAHLSVSGIGEVILDYATSGHQPAVEKWARSVSRTPNLTSVVSGDQRSDIPGNHAILFGIGRDKLSLVGINSRMSRIEARTANRISFDQMTHVEVPANDVATTEAFLRAHGVNLPVLAMEDVEAVLSRFSAKDLVNNTLNTSRA